MNRCTARIDLAVFLGILLAALSSAQAQQTGKIFRIGILDVSTASGRAVLWETFRQELSKLGWIEGKNITIEHRFADNNIDRFPELVEDLIRLKVDLIVVPATSSALVVKKATTTIPIVITGASDPVGAGLVASLARPGGNVTGQSTLSPDLNTKRLEILKDTVPTLTRLGLLRLPGARSGQDIQLKELRLAAVALKLTVENIETEADLNGLENAFQTAKQKRVNAIMTTTTPQFFGVRKLIVEVAAKRRLPASYPQKEFVDAGGLMSYGVDSRDLYQRAAGYVDKILKGAKPADLPVEQPRKFEFVINLKAAKQIGLTIPPNVLARADNVIR